MRSFAAVACTAACISACGSQAATGSADEAVQVAPLEQTEPVTVAQPPMQVAIRTSAQSRITVSRDGGAHSGVFDRSMIERDLEGQMHAIGECYEALFDGAASPAGQLDLRFRVEPNGVVQGAEITTNTSGFEQLEVCVLAPVRRMRFPDGPPEPESFEYRFQFQVL